MDLRYTCYGSASSLRMMVLAAAPAYAPPPRIRALLLLPVTSAMLIPIRSTRPARMISAHLGFEQPTDLGGSG